MKKIITFLSVALMLSTTNAVHSQDFKHEVSVGVGVWSSPEILDVFSDVITTGITAGTEIVNDTYLGVLHVGYKYALTHRIGVGGTFAFDYGTAEGLYIDEKQGDYNKYYFTIAAEADYKYLNRGKFRLYALLGLGATFYNQIYQEVGSINDETEHDVFVNFQITPIGIKYGKSFGGFFELGFGYKGIVSAGIFKRL